MLCFGALCHALNINVAGSFAFLIRGQLALHILVCDGNDGHDEVEHLQETLLIFIYDYAMGGCGVFSFLRKHTIVIGFLFAA